MKARAPSKASVISGWSWVTSAAMSLWSRTVPAGSCDNDALRKKLWSDTDLAFGVGGAGWVVAGAGVGAAGVVSLVVATVLELAVAAVAAAVLKRAGAVVDAVAAAPLVLTAAAATHTPHDSLHCPRYMSQRRYCRTDAHVMDAETPSSVHGCTGADGGGVARASATAVVKGRACVLLAPRPSSASGGAGCPS